jgi:DNA-binding CsgD family transcriptional regulator
MSPRTVRLSPRQQAALESVASGLTNKEIAAKLGIAVPTVNQHIRVLFLKFRAKNRAELMVKAFLNGALAASPGAPAEDKPAEPARHARAGLLLRRVAKA